jgi:hypothetical protein
VTVDTVVESGVLSKLVAIVNAVLHLGLPPSASNANVTTTISSGLSLLNDLNTAAANLVTSRTIRAFLRNLDHLLDISLLLKSWLSSCACVNKNGLSELVEEVNALAATIGELTTFCSSHPVVTVLPASATVSPDHPFFIRPSDLLVGLRLHGGADAISDEPHNNLLSVLGLGVEGHHPPTPSIDSNLSDKIAALAHLVIVLQDDLTAFPPAPVDVNLLVSIGQVTKNLLNATTASDVIASLEHLAALSDASVHILENCGCIGSLGLQQMHSNLRHILGVASEAFTWCHSHPIVPGSNAPPLANSTDANVPVEVGLSDLLNRLSLGLLGPIGATTAVAGLGGGLSNTANGLLDSLNIGPHNAKRGLIAKINPRNLIDPSLLSCLEVLVNLMAKLWVSATLGLSSSQPCIGSSELALVKEMANALTSITPSTTIPAMLTHVNRMLVAESSLEKALQTCSDGEDLVEVLVKISKATLHLSDLCGSSMLVEHSSLLPTTSRTVTSARRLPSTATPLSFVTRLPTGTRTSSMAISTWPASSDDEVIVALNHLLSSFGLGAIKGVVILGGLGHELNEPVNRLLDGLQIGPHDLRRRQVVQNRSTLHSALQMDVNALVDLFIALVGECGTLNCTSRRTPQKDLLDASVQEVVGVLMATSWSKFVGSLDHLTTTSIDALKLLGDCECVAERKLEGVYISMVKVVDASLALQRLCRQMDIIGAKVGGVDGQPVVVGLARLLKALRNEGRRVVVSNGFGDAKLGSNQ